ncbi:hypothetical protein [Aquiflexum balticum]|nr:hypothetical protein [Aquiflexum balticum]
MREFEDFTLREILKADFRAQMVFKNFGIDSKSLLGKTVKEICKRYRIKAEYLLDSIVENMDSKVVWNSKELN